MQLHRRIAISFQFADRVRVRVKYDRVSQRPHDVGPVVVLFTMLLEEEVTRLLPLPAPKSRPPVIAAKKLLIEYPG